MRKAKKCSVKQIPVSYFYLNFPHKILQWAANMKLSVEDLVREATGCVRPCERTIYSVDEVVVLPTVRDDQGHFLHPAFEQNVNTTLISFQFKPDSQIKSMKCCNFTRKAILTRNFVLGSQLKSTPTTPLISWPTLEDLSGSFWASRAGHSGRAARMQRPGCCPSYHDPLQQFCLLQTLMLAFLCHQAPLQGPKTQRPKNSNSTFPSLPVPRAWAFFFSPLKSTHQTFPSPPPFISSRSPQSRPSLGWEPQCTVR